MTLFWQQKNYFNAGSGGTGPAGPARPATQSPQPAGSARPAMPSHAVQQASATPVQNSAGQPISTQPAAQSSIPSVAGLRLNTGGMLGQNAIATPAHHPTTIAPAPTQVRPAAPHLSPPQRSGPAANAPAPTYEEKRLAKLQSSGATVIAPAGNTKSINPKGIVESLPFDTPGSRAGVAARPGQQATATGDDDAPIVRYLQKALLTAIELGVSDLHWEPYETGMRLRYRMDGILKIVATNIPPDAREKLITRIKVLSKLDIAEKRVPQDGRLKLNVTTTKAIDFRVSSLPTIWGEKIVMRILNSDVELLDLNLLGYEPEQLRTLLDVISKPYGMVLVTGPTGSGKTVSLYSCLSILNDGERNISTAEDPCEIQVVGINQVSVNEKAGLTFASAMRSFLRQDPDIIMVGEIRDLETADIAVKASQTGHLVFSTLHTNDAPSTLVRLLNMGVPAFNIASSVMLITAQRLVRKLCKACKKPHTHSRQDLLDAGATEKDLEVPWTTFTTVGCEVCEGTGFKGRLGVYQVMPITPEMEKLILANGTAPEIAALAQEQGVWDLRQAGLLKVKSGLTTLEEIVANTKMS